MKKFMMTINAQVFHLLEEEAKDKEVSVQEFVRADSSTLVQETRGQTAPCLGYGRAGWVIREVGDCES